MKGAATHAVNECIDRRDMQTFAWQGEYGVHSFGEQILPTVVDYVENQPVRYAARDLWPGLERVAEHESSPT